MKRLITAGCILGLFACSNTNEFDADLDKQVSKPANTSTTSQNTGNGSFAQPAGLPIQPQVSSTPVQPTTAAAAVTTTPATATTTPAGLNPPHGMPGHTCDLPEGAPLNSKPANAATGKTSPQVTVSPVTTTTKKTAPGMNPPHGEPGHRCDIPEGSPLNAAPAKPAQVTPVTPVSTTPAEVKPPVSDTTRN